MRPRFLVVLAAVALAAVAVELAACGGRTLEPPDDDDDDDSDSDSDSDADSDSDGDGGVVLCDQHGVEDCPWRLPYCCSLWPDGYYVCTDDPEAYLEKTMKDYEWWCGEKVREESLVSVDCEDFGEYHPELCPDGFPYCCIYDGGVEVCADHELFGWPCGD